MDNGESRDQRGAAEGAAAMETETVRNKQGKKTGGKSKPRKNQNEEQKSKPPKPSDIDDMAGNELENNGGRTLPWKAGTMDKGPQTKTVENQQGKKTGSKRNMRQNQKEKRKSKSPQVPDIDEMMENDIENDEGRTLPWKERSFCHFTWNLKVPVTTDYQRIIRNIDHDLEETPNLLRIEGLLFRAYLEVWDNGKRWDVHKAREFLDKADKYIEKTDAQLQTGYRVVALLNRMWIEYKCHNAQRVADLLSKLDKLRLRHKDHSVIGAVHATALTRLGPRVMETALQLFEVALQSFPEKGDFIYGAGLMSGRMARYRRIDTNQFEKMDQEGQRLMNSEKEYWEKMKAIKKDEYQLATSALGLNLSRRGTEDERREGYRLMREAVKKAPQVQEVVRNLAKSYKGKQIEQAIPILKDGIERSPDCHESHFQLALCYTKCAEKDKAIPEKKANWNKQALKELQKCLKLNNGHNLANMTLCKVHRGLGNNKEAEKIYNASLQQSEHRTIEDNLHLYFEYANYLEYTPTASEHESRMDMWRKVMDAAASFEYLDEASGTWQVRKKARKPKTAAYNQLLKHCKTNPCLEVGILHFQNFSFGKATKELIKLDTEGDFNIPWYLGQTYWKMGLQEEQQALSKNLRPEKAKETFKKAHDKVLGAMRFGLKQRESRELLADIALAIAHNELQLLGQDTIPLESQCIVSYREAVRCGSLVASLELLRLVQKDSLEVTSRWIFLQILAEIDVSCSLRGTNLLHQEEKPFSFEKGLSSRDRDKDALALNCKTIKRDVMAILHQEPFFRQAWREHFNMEKEILRHRFENNEGELELDGREEDKKETFSDEIVYAATDCCEKLRPLLDRIVVRKKELGNEEMKNQYFPLILDDKAAREAKKKFQIFFGIDMEKYYPKLNKQILKAQPVFLGTLYSLVNKIKHSDIDLSAILETSKDPVTLARQCTDKVEEICRFFFNAMKEAEGLWTNIRQLARDIGDGKYEKAEELLRALSSNKDFVVRIGSRPTWELLQVIAQICHSGKTSSKDLFSKMTDGTCALTQNLRRCHRAVEDALLKTDPRSEEVRTECRDTCKVAVELLNSVLAKHKNQHQTSPQEPIAFPFLDMRPDDEILQRYESDHWKGIVEKQLGKNVSKMRVDKKLVDIILKAQPCTDEENYQFIAMEEFLKQCDEGGDIPGKVSIQPDNQEEKTFQVLDLTRWITDNTERIAIKIDAVKVARQ
ncbi:uncharacterized protein LOC119728060 [Patiria miniata]|uniref:Uncharacterized protein n=1 Tax=Patiria miniata TaxID=46514 RepID=A0A913ZX17_PATMI|nr:uncharacterized protein LOC119728060 [Patiria miniata]